MTGQRTSGIAAGRLWAGGRRDGGGGGAGRDRGGVRWIWVVRRSVLVPGGSGTWEGVGTVVYALVLRGRSARGDRAAAPASDQHSAGEALLRLDHVAGRCARGGVVSLSLNV